VLNHYGYLAVGGLIFLEDFGVPVPGETMLIVGAVYAGAGRLNVVAVASIAFVAAVLGDNLGFAIGHFGGRALVLRWGRYVFLTGERLGKAEGFFARHGGKVVTIARFVEGLRQANGIVAGLSKMRWPRFLLFNVLGAALWVALWTTVGYTAGGHLNSIYHQLVHYEAYLGGAIVALIVAVVARKLWQRHRRTSDEHTTSGQSRS
jgi:membrane protein DedA with SNARE-associated domain